MPSPKNPGYSPERYQPPARTSLEEMLLVARRRVAMPGKGWTEKLATRPFVEDLVKRGFINGPYQKRRDGRGQGQRLLPNDYRDLLRIIRLKALGIKRRQAWLLHLWLMGRDFPLSTIHAALLSEVKKLIDETKRDIAPTQRWTEPFGTKYDRRVRQRPDGLLMPDMVDFFEPLAAHMIRPTAMQEVNPDINNLASELENIVGKSATDIAPVIESVLDALKRGNNLNGDEQSNIASICHEVASQAGLAEIFEFLVGTAADTVDSTRGLIDDGKGHSMLFERLKSASHDHLVSARLLFRAMMTMPLQPGAYNKLPEPLRKLTIGTVLEQRRMARANPRLSFELFAMYVDDAVRTRPPTP